MAKPSPARSGAGGDADVGRTQNLIYPESQKTTGKNRLFVKCCGLGQMKLFI
jgi:hypothetical protein